MAEWRADDLKTLALHFLRGRYPGALLTCELAGAQWGSASMDVAAVVPPDDGYEQGPRIAAVEVKGDGDSSTTRLTEQAALYGRVADDLWCVVAPSLYARAAKKWPHRPSIMTVGDDGDLTDSMGQYEEHLRGDPLDGAPAAPVLARLLWAHEARALVRETLSLHGGMPPETNGMGRVLAHHAQAWCAENVPLCVLRKRLCQALCARKHSRPGRPARQNIGEPKPKLVYLPDDPLPEVRAMQVEATADG